MQLIWSIYLYPVKYYQKGMYQLQMCNFGSVCCLITPGPRGHSMLILCFLIFEYSSKHRKSVHALDVNSFVQGTGANMPGRHSTWTCSAYVFLELLKFWDVSMSHQDTQALELVERVARENYNSPKVDAHRWVLTRMDNGKASMAHAKIGWSFTTCWFHLFICFVFVECREDSWSLSKVVIDSRIVGAALLFVYKYWNTNFIICGESWRINTYT